MDRPNNEERGEISLSLDGADYVLRPSHEAIDAFERATGKGLLQLTREALTGMMTVAEASQIAATCIKAWGREVKNEDAAGVNAKRVASLMMEADGGFRLALGTLASVLSLASTGGYTAKGEIKPAVAATGEANAAG